MAVSITFQRLPPASVSLDTASEEEIVVVPRNASSQCKADQALVRGLSHFYAAVPS